MTRTTPIGLLTQTNSSKVTIVPRLIAAVPLIGINIMHLTGAAPLEPILIGAGIPMPGINAIIGPIFGVLAGVLILSGAFARVGSVIAIGSMFMALFAHVRFDWADEPLIVLPIAVIAASAWVLWKGAGAWSVDGRTAALTVDAQPA